MSDRWFRQEQHRQARLAALHQEVMIGTTEADRGERLDGESAMAALRDKLESWKQQDLDASGNHNHDMTTVQRTQDDRHDIT
jgi:hypothetical protein